MSQSPKEPKLISGGNALEERTEPYHAFRTLGVYIAPSGCQKKQIEILRNHVQIYHDQLHSASLLPLEACLSYLLNLHPQINRPSFFQHAHVISVYIVTSSRLAALLPKLHMNRHTSHLILFSGPCYGGLHLSALSNDQGLGQLTLYLGHMKLGVSLITIINLENG